MGRYPEPLQRELLGAIAEAHGLDASQIVVSNGTATIIDALLRLVAKAHTNVVHAWRTFEAVVPLMSAAGVESVPVPLKNERHDFDAMLARINADTGFVYICNPNNPNGTVHSSAELRRFIRAVPSDTIIVLDEAYIHFAEGNDTLDGLAELASCPNLIVLRTFSKAHGLAAVRSGFAAASPELAAELSKVVAPFSVTNMAAAATIATLGDAELAVTRARIAEVISERVRLVTGIEALEVPVVSDSAANFIFLPTSRGQEIAAAFEHEGLIVRPYADGVRVTVGLPAENTAVLDAVERIAQGGLFKEGQS